MSFGFGVGDFLAVAKLTHEIWQKLQDSVDQFATIHDEIVVYSSLLDTVSISVPKQNLSPKQAQGLNASAHACGRVLEDLQKLVDKYSRLTNKAHGLTANVRQKFKKLQWDPDDARDLRARITSTTAVLLAFSESLAKDHQAHNEICQWLSPLDFPAQQREIYRRRQQGSGQWLLQSEKFKRWLQSEGGVLLCPGDPGAGKTVLASIVIDHLWNGVRKDGIGVAYIYCDYLKHGEQTPIHLVGSLLKQLAEQQNPMSESLRNYYKEHKRSNTNPSPERAIEVLKAECDSWSRIYIIIDALDECSEKDATRQILVKGLLSLQSSKRINILVTSRPIPSILCNLEVWERLEIRADSEDIHRYLLGQMDRFSKRILAEKDLQAKIISEIIDAADGMFLLARLTFDTLVGHKTLKAIKGTLDKLSKGTGSLDSAYDDAMKRIEDQDSDDRDLAKKTLLWMSQGQRSLSAAEMQQAVAIELGESDLDPDNTVDCDDIISACTGLVTRDRDSQDRDILRLVHYTTQEYLERTKIKYFPKAQEDLASSCLTYLLFDVFSGALCLDGRHGVRSNDSDTGVGTKTTEFFCFGCKECWNAEQHEEGDWEVDAYRNDPCSDLRSKQYPFYEYAVRYWGHHAENCDDEAIRMLTKTFLDDTRRVSGICHHHLYESVYPDDSVRLKLGDFDPGSAMQLAAFLGLTKVVSKRLEDGSEPDVKDEVGRTPLFWAVIRGHEDVVKLLITREDVNPNIRTSKGKTPLIVAVRKEYIAIVQLLLACDNIDINAKDVTNGWSALVWAMTLPHEDLRIMNLLLTCDDIEVNLEDRLGQTPLMIAILRRSVKVMQFLLAHGDIQINVLDGESEWRRRNALHHAALQTWTEGMRLLLAHENIQVNAEDSAGETALHIAAREGWVEGIWLLVTHENIQVNVKGSTGRTALHMIAQRSKFITCSGSLRDRGRGMQLLLAHDDIQVNIMDERGQTALHITAQQEHAELMQLLLARDDIQVNGRDHEGETALYIAVKQKWAAGTQLLLAHGDIQVNERDNQGQTVLHIAARDDLAEEEMRLLLAHEDIQVNIKDNQGQTALHIAVRGDWTVEEMRLLLAHEDIQVNIKDNQGQTALHIAARRDWTKEELRLLLAHEDIQVNMKDNEGSTALHVAVLYRAFEAGQLLLTRDDLEVNATDDNGESALFGAVRGTYDTPNLGMAELLLARGDVNLKIRNKYGETPLYYAVHHGKLYAVQLFLTREDLEIGTKDGEGEILVSLAEDERDKAESKDVDAYDRIIGLLRSYIQQKSSNTTSANIM